MYGGYLADMTRTVAVGHVSDEQRKVYETIKEAQKRAFDKIRPGAICKEDDAAARDYIYEQGYRGCFSHGWGTVSDVEVHENPRFNEVCNRKTDSGHCDHSRAGHLFKRTLWRADRGYDRGSGRRI